MSETSSAVAVDVPVQYIRENFAPEDRLAVVVRNTRTGRVIQRIATSSAIAELDFQAWLREHNEQGRSEIYISMNALDPTATGRTKRDVVSIRHIYLDFDEDGTAALERLLNRQDLPAPNYALNSSPDKWQVVWKVEGFSKDEAENLQRCLARETGADPAATDCSRVLRLPGFYNQKYAVRYLVSVRPLSSDVFRPEHFQKFPVNERDQTANGQSVARRSRPSSKLSQSERDWAYAKRALTRGEPQDMIINAIALHRRFDKHNPKAYAQLTVRKAAESLSADEQGRVPNTEPER